ncbi:MAG: hypothetical protein HY866_23770, partial [Chloroflexi bacterium]|nr:hypothetical protein [Chloroflexota bacterium]
YNDGLAALGEEYDLSADPTDAAYGLTLVALDAFSYEYWETVYPALPECAEAQALAFVIGSMYDEYLTIGLLVNVSAWADAAESPEDAQAFADQAASRMEIMDSTMEVIADMSMTDLAAALVGDATESCTEEQITGLADSMSGAFDELGAGLDELGDDPLLTFALTEGAAFAFENEAYAEVAVCAENLWLAEIFRVTLNQTNIVAGLYANAAAEEAAGNTDVAEALVTSADQRAADLETAWEEIGAMAEME